MSKALAKRIVFWCIAALLPFEIIPAQALQRKLAKTCDSVFSKAIENGLAPGGVLAIVTTDSVLLVKGYGRANVQRKQPVDGQTTVFQVGSIGKVFTALAVLQLVGEGKLDLDADVNQYLGHWNVSNPFPEHVTLRRLLTHSAGFDERITGYAARYAAQVEPLEQHLSHRMPAVFHPPGSQINYSNYSYGLAGLLVEKTSGMPFREYVSHKILRPLGMGRSTYLTDGLGDQATGYKGQSGQLEEAPLLYRHVTPAGSIASTGGDMAVFMQALLKRDTALGGALREGLFKRQFASHPALPGYTFGLESQRINGHEAVGKGGAVPGLLSGMVFLPELELGIFAAINISNDDALDSLFLTLNKVLPKKKEAEKLVPSGQAVDLSTFTGTYRNNRCNHSSIEEFFQLFQSPMVVSAQGNGLLEMRLDGWIYTFKAVNDTVFQEVDLSEKHLVFSQVKNGKAQSAFIGLEVNGLQLPASYGRVSWYDRPRFINDEFPVLVYPVIGFYSLLPLIWLLAWGIRRWRRTPAKGKGLGIVPHSLAISFSLMAAGHLLGFLLPLAKRREELLFGMPTDLYWFKYLHWAMVPVALSVTFIAVGIWRKKAGRLPMRIYYSLFAMAALALVLFLYRWHFLSMAY